MTTTLRLLLSALAVLALVQGGLNAQDTPRSRARGRVLVLQNFRALEGDIERVGDQYRVRQTAGEISLPADKVLWLCATWEEAFAMLCKQANMRDPDERLRLAQWCQQNGLHAQALIEGNAAARMRPEHAKTKWLLAVLQQTAAQQAAPAAAPPSREATAPVAAVDLSSESLSTFTARVQPILMNTCASCHATGRGGAFKLARCSDPSLNRRGLHQNLAAVLAQVNLEKPAFSPLLFKSVSLHGGGAQPPLPSRQSVLFQALRDWVEGLAVNDPHLLRKEVVAVPIAGSRPSAPPQATVAPGVVLQAAPGQEGAVLGTGGAMKPASVPFAAGPAAPNAPSTESASAAQAIPGDTYSPWPYNQQMHPQR